MGAVIANFNRVERKSTKNRDNCLPTPEASPGEKRGVGGWGLGREGEGERKKMPQIASRAIFKFLLKRVTKLGTLFCFNSKLYKKVGGFSMGNSLSPTLANILMRKLEEDAVTPHNFPFYDRNVDDCFTKKKTNAPDNLLKVAQNSFQHFPRHRF